MTKISVKSLSVSFGEAYSLKDVNIDIEARRILTVIGPANSGKTTFLRTLNRLNDLEDSVSVTGRILLDGQDIYHRDYDANLLRKKVGIIFALPVPLPATVFENVVYGPRRQGVRDRKKLASIAEEALKDAYLWDEMKDRLDEQAMKLSGGQQQRLCIARTLAVGPEVILFDEPCSALDPISTGKIEEAMSELKQRYTIVLVTNNTKQAARVGDKTAFFLMGELVEIGETGGLFTSPQDKRTDDYLSGRFG
ncbi:MAG: phosphate ABC transporter ATP-binding protein [Omnitrophica bacterium RIFCSPHIGHO2_02_FULL_63_14]|nr:MAG: phosphate ABC transporter ATP-binding protein [Omnitrophica bacterium RIFCSPHIGHO2_02_FULL_63_14]